MAPLDIYECISFLEVSSMLLFCIRMISSFAEILHFDFAFFPVFVFRLIFETSP